MTPHISFQVGNADRKLLSVGEPCGDHWTRIGRWYLTGFEIPLLPGRPKSILMTLRNGKVPREFLTWTKTPKNI